MKIMRRFELVLEAFMFHLSARSGKKKSIALISWVVMAVVTIALPTGAFARTLTKREQRASGIYFLGSDSQPNATTTVSGSVTGTNNCFELPLPQINDQALFAKAIDDYLTTYAPAASPFQGLGADIVQGAVRNSVNPLYVVGNMRVESQYGTSGTQGHSEVAALLHVNFNAFGRTAGSSQPHFHAGNHDWYIYPSWKDSVNSPTSSDTNTTDQPSLMKKVYLDAGVVTLAQYLNKYAPNGQEGNDDTAYGEAVKDTARKIIALAGTSLSCQDNTTTITPNGPSGNH